MKNLPIKQLTVRDLIEVDDSLFPMIAFSQRKQDFISEYIKTFTNAEYSHVMWFHRPGYFATQDWTFKEVTVSSYIGYTNVNMEIIYFSDWVESERKRFLYEINKLVNRKGFYDILGVIGHFFKNPKIQINNLNYCSESIWNIFQKINYEPEWHPTPKELRWYLKKYYRAKVYGTYKSELNLPKGIT